MTGGANNNPPGDQEHTAQFPWLSRKLLWVDDPRKVTALVWTLAVVCAGLALADFTYHKHSYFPIEEVPGFYGLYGFFMCAALVIAAKGLRVLLKRDESYYAPRSVESEEHPAADLSRENADA